MRALLATRLYLVLEEERIKYLLFRWSRYIFSNPVITITYQRQDEKPFMTGLRHCPHRETTTPKSTNRTESLSSLAPVHSDGRIIKFITGGHDKKVILWTARGFAATSEVITRCSTVPITLNFCDRTVMCGTGMRLLTLDIEHRTAKPTSIKFSNPVLQVHVHPDAPTISIVEVSSSLEIWRSSWVTLGLLLLRSKALTSRSWYTMLVRTIALTGQPTSGSGIEAKGSRPRDTIAAALDSAISLEDTRMAVFVYGIIGMSRYLSQLLVNTISAF